MPSAKMIFCLTMSVLADDVVFAETSLFKILAELGFVIWSCLVFGDHLLLGFLIHFTRRNTLFFSQFMMT